LIFNKINIFFLISVSLTVFFLSFGNSNAQHPVDTAGIRKIENKEPHAEEFNIIEKVVDHDYVDFYFLGKLPLPQFPPIEIGGMSIDLSVTKSLFMMVVSSIILILFLIRAEKLIKKIAFLKELEILLKR